MTEQTAPYKFSHIAFPSIGQYRDVIKQVQQQAKYHQVPVPEILFRGTIKMHGTNAAVVLGLDGEVYAQSRERVITHESDNAGFATWLHQHKEHFKKILKSFSCESNTTNTVQIYGEWCGGNIQKGVGLSKLPKMFVIFGVRISENAESDNWIDINTLRAVIDLYGLPDNTYLNVDFPVFYMQIDFNKPEYAQNVLQELTINVEKDCPVARKFLHDSTDELIGEGIVWEAVTGDPVGFSVRGLRFKTKGEKHSASKVKVIAAVDLEKVATVDDFVDQTCTKNRLNQGLDKLKEKGLEQTSQNTGEFIRWVVSDILKEEIDLLSESGLTSKDISGKIAGKARDFYLKSI